MTGKPKIPEPLIEEKLENLPSYNYTSPEHTSHVMSSEGEAPLLATSTESDVEMSPSYVKAPLEDRSKYEKLVQGARDISSDSSEQEDRKLQLDKEKISKKKKINIPERLHNVYKTVELPIKNFRSEKNKGGAKKRKSNDPKNSEDVDSDDSIGSASDLRIDDDNIEDDATKVKDDKISETVSQSIQTCGSSAYHAECESMAAQEDDINARRVKAKQKEEAKKAIIEQSEDMLFIGHQYGEKPLLMDDELDSDCEISQQPKTGWTPDKDKVESLWIPPSSSFDCVDDVFSLAPFTTTKVKKVDKYVKNAPEGPFEGAQEVSTSLNPFLNDDFSLINAFQSSENVAKVSIDSDYINVELPSGTLENINYFEGVQFQPNFGDNTNQYFENPKDLKLENKFRTIEIHEEVNQYLERPTDLQLENAITNVEFAAPNIQHNESINKIIEISPFASTNTTQYFEKPNDRLEQSSIIKKIEIPKPKLFDEKPSVKEYKNDPHLLFSDAEDDDSSNILMNMSIKSKKDKKKDKDKDKDKAKYNHLVDDCVSDEGPSFSTPKNPKMTKTVGSSSKKSGSKSKKTPLGKIRLGEGFSNMSFEDFPSDEREIIKDSEVPFEVLRSPVQEERKGNSLKRISKPFS